jgi:hypothetical protein
VPGALTTADFVKMLTNGLKGKPDSAYPLAYFLAHIDKLDPKKRVKLASRIGAQGQTLFEPSRVPRGSGHLVHRRRQDGDGLVAAARPGDARAG